MDEVATDILILVRHFGGKHTALTSELYHDLNLSEHEADKLLKAVTQRYSTSFDGLKLELYFPTQTQTIPKLARWLGLEDKSLASFTVDHLVRCVRRGHWFEPAEDGALLLGQN